MSVDEKRTKRIYMLHLRLNRVSSLSVRDHDPMALQGQWKSATLEMEDSIPGGISGTAHVDAFSDDTRIYLRRTMPLPRKAEFELLFGPSTCISIEKNAFAEVTEVETSPDRRTSFCLIS